MVPEVKKCTVTQCFYNQDQECRAHAILVGSSDPICETFAQSENRIRHSGTAEVGACHISNCQYNQQMSCHACSDIEVVWNKNNAWCNTFEPR